MLPGRVQPSTHVLNIGRVAGGGDSDAIDRVDRPPGTVTRSAATSPRTPGPSPGSENAASKLAVWAATPDVMKKRCAAFA